MSAVSSVGAITKEQTVGKIKEKKRKEWGEGRNKGKRRQQGGRERIDTALHDNHTPIL